MRPFLTSISVFCLIGGMANGWTCDPPKSDSPSEKTWEMKLVKPKEGKVTWLAETKEPVRDFADGELGKSLRLNLSKIEIKGAKNVSVKVYASSKNDGAPRELVGELFFFPSTGDIDSGFVVDIAPALKKLDSADALRKDRPLVVSIEPAPAHPDRAFELKGMTVEKATLSRPAKK